MKQIKNNALIWTAIQFTGVSFMLAGLFAIISWLTPIIFGMIFFLTSEVMLRKLAKKVKNAISKE